MSEGPRSSPASATVFFTGDGPADAGIRRLVNDWCVSGLVGDSVWVSAGTWRKTKLELQELAADVISAEGQSSDRLLPILGAVRLDVLCVVMVHVVASNGDGDPELTRLGDALLHKLRDYLPDRASLRAINLIVPASGVSGIPPEILLETPHASLVNVVASPEDRMSDSHISVGVRSGKDGNLEGHAALAAVTAAGLWVGMGDAPFDERPYPSLAGEHIVVSRCFAAVAQVEPIIDAVSEQALSPRHDWPVPDREGKVPPIPALDPPRLVERMVERCGTLEAGAFRYQAYQAPPPPPARAISIWGAFVEMFQFLWRGLLRLPRDVGHSIKTAAVQKAEQLGQKMTFGEGSSVAVRLGGQRLTDGSLSVDSLLSDASRVLEVAGILGETYAPANPELWRALRGLSFGLVDGSELPTPFEKPLAGDRRQVVTQTPFIAPDPFDPESPGVRAAVGQALGLGTVDLPSCDPYSASVAKSALEYRLAEVAASEEGTAEQRKAEAERVQEALAALRGWVGRQAPALLWQLAERVAAEVAKARQDLADALQELANVKAEEDSTRVSAAWRRCKRRWLLIVVLGAAGIVLTWQLPLSELRSYGLTAGVSVLGLACFVLAFFSFRRVVFQELNRAERARFALTAAYERALQAAREIVRLGSLYEQLADWGEILGGVVHRPWGRPQVSTEEHRLPTDPALPKGLSVAAGRTGEEQRGALAAGAAHEVYDQGWVTEAYERFTSAALDRLSIQNALSSRPDPDMDTRQAPNGARRHLKQEIAGDRHAREAFARGRSRVATFMRDQAPAKLVTEVCPLRPKPGSGEPELGDPLTPGEFFGRVLPNGEQFLLAEIWSDKAKASTLHRVERCRVWAPEGIGPPNDEASFVRQELAEVELPGGGLSLKAIRLDCSPPCTGSDLRIFASRESTEQPVFVDNLR